MELSIWQCAFGTPANPTTGQPAIPPDLEAQRQIWRIMDRRARYVPGLEVPARVNTAVVVAAVTPKAVPAEPQLTEQCFAEFVQVVMAGQLQPPSLTQPSDTTEGD